MKACLLIACAALGLVGCATEKYSGGVNSPYESEYGRGYSTMWGPTLEYHDSIYPVRKQPSPNGNDMGGIRPLIDPSRQRDWYNWGDETYYRDYPPRVTVHEPQP